MKVIEIFTSVQGEGKHMGVPQVFLRLAGCNLHCSWCDTQYAWSGGDELVVEDVFAKIKKKGLKSVCITGGEPMLQKEELRELVLKLNADKYFILIETNGTIYDKEIFELADCISLDLKPPSSGMKSDETLIEQLTEKDQIKIVMAVEPDFEYAKKIIALHPPCEIILQPAQGVDYQKLSQKIIDENLDVRVLPQLHKMVGVR